MLASVCCGLIRIGARHGACPDRLDRPLAKLAIRVIRFYQRRLSRHTGRTCLFHPSCSSRVVSALEASGWREGLRFADAQLTRCGGDFSICVACTGETWLVTNDDRRFSEDEISPLVLARHARQG